MFNRREIFRRCIESSCSEQLEPVELIGVDNTQARFDCAAKALNWGGAQASGKWVVFVHQDVVLIDRLWTAYVGDLLDKLEPTGWAGVIGRDSKGQWQGILRDRDCVFGEPFSSPREVQTLDEVVLIHRNEADRKYFDESLAYWHAYGVDACCEAILNGKKNYVLPAPIWHDSPSTNRSGLREANSALSKKYRGRFKIIHGCCGDIPDRFEKRGSFRKFLLFDRLKAWWWGAIVGCRPRSFSQTRKPLDVVDDWTLDEKTIVWRHDDFWINRIDAIGINDATKCPRSVIHVFGEEDLNNISDYTLLLSSVSTSKLGIPSSVRKVVTLEVLQIRREIPRSLEMSGFKRLRQEIARDQDDRYWVITEYKA